MQFEHNHRPQIDIQTTKITTQWVVPMVMVYMVKSGNPGTQFPTFLEKIWKKVRNSEDLPKTQMGKRKDVQKSDQYEEKDHCLISGGKFEQSLDLEGSIRKIKSITCKGLLH